MAIRRQNAPERLPLELYVHIPFCVRKCGYCDFLSMPADDETKARYVEQLIKEIRAQSSAYSEYHVTSIYFGGGTPSILKSTAIASIMSAIYECWYVDASAEVTVECNPGTVDKEKLGMYKASGVNRISIGLQSVHEKELKLLGRIHTFEDFLSTYQYARDCGIENINVDLMSGLPRQSKADWEESLKRVAMLKPEHISAYSLIVEEGTPFFDMYGTPEGKLLLPDEDTDRDMYHRTREILEKKGYERYEISNYAKPGYESRHNIGYWTGAEYLGLGLGASSLIKRHRFHNENDMRTYLEYDFTSDVTMLYQDLQKLQTEDEMSEFMILGLRMIKGVSGDEFARRFGMNMFKVYDMPIFRNKTNGLLEVDGPQVRLTERGLDLANVVMRDFV
jgi:oxygen-independent coproporphyrinogen III oxidase